jgi:hypothetical protein
VRVRFPPPALWRTPCALVAGRATQALGRRRFAAWPPGTIPAPGTLAHSVRPRCRSRDSGTRPTPLRGLAAGHDSRGDMHAFRAPSLPVARLGWSHPSQMHPDTVGQLIAIHSDIPRRVPHASGVARYRTNRHCFLGNLRRHFRETGLSPRHQDGIILEPQV